MNGGKRQSKRTTFASETHKYFLLFFLNHESTFGRYTIYAVVCLFYYKCKGQHNSVGLFIYGVMLYIWNKQHYCWKYKLAELDKYYLRARQEHICDSGRKEGHVV